MACSIERLSVREVIFSLGRKVTGHETITLGFFSLQIA